MYSETSSDQRSKVVEGYDANRAGVLARDESLDHGLQVGGFEVSFAPSTADGTEIVGNETDGLVVAGNNGRCPLGPTHKTTLRNRTGIQVASRDSFRLP
jgi:hypothetical protein